MARRVVDVLVPVALDQAYSYRVPDGVELAPGDIVSVPLGAREATGVVWAENPKPNPRLDNRLKDIEEKLDVPPLKPELRKFVDWVSELHAEPARHGAAHVPAHGRAPRPERERVGVRLAGPPPARMTRGARARAARCWPTAWCGQGRRGARSRRQRRRHRRPGRRRHAGDAGAAAGAGRGRARSGLSARRISRRRSARRPRRCATPSRKGGYSVTLLDGVTGSGKTEVYFEAVAETIRKRPADADPDAGDRAHRRSSSTASPRASACGRRNGIRNCRRAGARAPGARSRPARCRSSSARARRCSCPMPISA